MDRCVACLFDVKPCLLCYGNNIAHTKIGVGIISGLGAGRVSIILEA